jgi:hypothetical protein
LISIWTASITFTTQYRASSNKLQATIVFHHTRLPNIYSLSSLVLVPEAGVLLSEQCSLRIGLAFEKMIVSSSLLLLVLSVLEIPQA